MDELIANDPECLGALMQAVPPARRRRCAIPAAGRTRGAASCAVHRRWRRRSRIGGFCVQMQLSCIFCLRRIPRIAIMALRGSLAPLEEVAGYADR